MKLKERQRKKDPRVGTVLSSRPIRSSLLQGSLTIPTRYLCFLQFIILAFDLFTSSGFPPIWSCRRVETPLHNRNCTLEISQSL